MKRIIRKSRDPFLYLASYELPHETPPIDTDNATTVMKGLELFSRG